MNDELWQLQHQSRHLQAFREELTGFWNDDAAHDLNVRFLVPHQNDDADMLSALDTQATLLDEVQKRLVQVSTFISAITLLSKQIDELVATSRQEYETSYQLYDLYINYSGEVRELLPEIESFIQSANKACHGVPSS